MSPFVIPVIRAAVQSIHTTMQNKSRVNLPLLAQFCSTLMYMPTSNISALHEQLA
jgi:hypothetical protein